MMHAFAAIAIMGVLWMILGYSMSFGHNVLGGYG
jgi:Amt family ammonium transporter